MLKITEGRDLLEKEARAFVAGIKRSSGAFDSTNFQSNIPPNLEYSFVYFLGTLKNCIFLSDTNVGMSIYIYIYTQIILYMTK